MFLTFYFFVLGGPFCGNADMFVFFRFENCWVQSIKTLTRFYCCEKGKQFLKHKAQNECIHFGCNLISLKLHNIAFFLAQVIALKRV